MQERGRYLCAGWVAEIRRYVSMSAAVTLHCRQVIWLGEEWASSLHELLNPMNELVNQVASNTSFYVRNDKRAKHLQMLRF